MKYQTKTTLLALAIAGVAASSHAAAYNNDLVIGFTSASGNDFIFDLGSFASLQNGETWDLSAQLATYNLNTVAWGVVGNTATGGSGRVLYSTLSLTPATVGAGTGSLINGADISIYSGFAVGGAGQFAFVDSTGDNSWNRQTLNPTLSTQYQNVWENPNAVGVGSITLWSVTANGSDPVQNLDFSLSSGGVVTYGTVPEPSTYAMFIGSGLLMVCFRNKFRRA